MTNAEMDAIEVQDTPVLLERALAPGFKLLGQRLVETTNRAGTGSDSHKHLGHFSDLVGARACHEHLGESFRNVGFVAAIPVKHLSMEVAFPVSGHLEILKPTGRGDQITAVEAVAISFPLGVAFSP